MFEMYMITRKIEYNWVVLLNLQKIIIHPIVNKNKK